MYNLAPVVLALAFLHASTFFQSVFNTCEGIGFHLWVSCYVMEMVIHMHGIVEALVMYEYVVLVTHTAQSPWIF